MEALIAKLDSVLYPIVCDINTYLSNYILVFLLIGVGLWYSIRTRFVQVRCFGEGMRKVFGNLSLNGKKHDSGMSSFQALATARHRQHRWRLRCHLDRRSRRHLLDVGHRLLRHGDHLCRGHAGH